MKHFYKPLLIGLASTALLGQGCLGAQQTPQDTDADMMESDGGAYLGSWSRQDVIVDGVSQGSGEAVLTFHADMTYTSVGTCALSGTYTENANQITLNVQESNCPGPTPGSSTYSYIISENGNQMITTTVYDGTEIREVYSRQ